LKLDKIYQGKTEADGEVYSVEEVEDAPNPFTANLDVGLARTTTGARVFGAMKVSFIIYFILFYLFGEFFN